jgi:hypothetical protein
MLTEGWDTNTVTHILGIRAFGTQLLCEQVVGRGLRRYSYDLNAEGLFNVEYADIMGIPFDFAAKPQVAPVNPPKKMTRVAAVRERAALEMIFPRVVGYRIDLPEEKLQANFSPNSKLVLTPDMVGPGQTLLEGIVGEGVTLTVAEMKDKRPSTVSYELAKYLLYSYFKDVWFSCPADGPPLSDPQDPASSLDDAPNQRPRRVHARSPRTSVSDPTTIRPVGAVDLLTMNFATGCGNDDDAEQLAAAACATALPVPIVYCAH